MKSIDEIKLFFLRRHWARPSDYDSILNKSISEQRQRDLSWFIRGYSFGKHWKENAENEEA